MSSSAGDGERSWSRVRARWRPGTSKGRGRTTVERSWASNSGTRELSTLGQCPVGERPTGRRVASRQNLRARPKRFSRKEFLRREGDGRELADVQRGTAERKGRDDRMLVQRGPRPEPVASPREVVPGHSSLRRAVLPWDRGDRC